MQKIISLFTRNRESDKLVRDEITPGAEWVVAGEGVATRKFDGTCCAIFGGGFFKRFEARVRRATNDDHESARVYVTEEFPLGFIYVSELPDSFIPATDIDPVTLKQQGWVRVTDGPEDQYHREGFDRLVGLHNGMTPPEGTYELVGPKVQGNPEGFEHHELVRHGRFEYPNCPRTFAALKQYLSEGDMEGIVWHHPDGRMVKIKAKDFGIKRAVK